MDTTIKTLERSGGSYRVGPFTSYIKNETESGKFIKARNVKRIRTSDFVEIYKDESDQSTVSKSSLTASKVTEFYCAVEGGLLD